MIRYRAFLSLVRCLLVAMILPAAVHAQGTATEKIIISGASGHLGGLTVEALLARGVAPSRLILVSRTPEKLEKYGTMGASVRFGDFTKPESLPAAYAGGTRMLLISVGGTKTEPAVTLLRRAIAAAKADGVKQIAYTSYIGISHGDTAGLAANHQQTEEDLKASGIPWTMLRNSIYMDNLVRQAAGMIAAGRATIPPNEFRIGYITRADCAAAAAAVLTTPGREYKAYDITGPELLGVRQIAAVASKVTGKPITVVEGGPDAKPGFGRPQMAYVSGDFRKLTGRAPTSVRELFEANKAALLNSGR